jgi:parvulin-like peptidyl-prolyl isomerase
MKRMIVLFAAAAAILAACSPKAEKFSLKQGTPAYALAQDLAKISPALAPDKETVLATAKDFVVTAGEIVQAAYDNLGKNADQLKSADPGQLKQVFDRAASSLAERKLLLAAAAKAKTAVADEELDKALQSEYAQAGGEQAFLEALKQGGVSIDHVKASVKETLLINKLLQGIAEDGAKVSEESLRKAYEQETVGDRTATVRHILVATEGKTEAEKAAAKTKIEGLLSEAKAGADFAELAKKYSEDPGSKDNGGLYEDFPRGQMVKPFEDAAFSVPVGEISGVIETSYGYHILKVIDRKKETRPFEAVRPELEAQLKRSQQGQAVQDYIQGLKDKAQLKLIGL